MPRPPVDTFSLSSKRSRHEPTRERIPCTKKRGYGHHWKIADPVDGVNKGKCSYCRKLREWGAYMPSSDYGVGILNDPLPKRNNVGDYGLRP